MNIQGIGTAIVIEHKEGVCIINHSDIESVFTTIVGNEYNVWAATQNQALYRLAVFGWSELEKAKEFVEEIYSRKRYHIVDIDNVLGMIIDEEVDTLEN